MPTQTPEFFAWQGMKNRCSNPKSGGWKLYGGRGIRVCKRWQVSFKNFLKDMGLRPSPKHSIDRIDNNGNYKPDNCRWATAKEQGRNKRTNLILNFRGQSRCLSEWAELLGVYCKTIKARLRRGWSVYKTLSAPLDPNRRTKNPKRMLTFKGKTMHLSAWARFLGLPEPVLRRRLFALGWSIHQAFTTPLKRHNLR